MPKAGKTPTSARGTTACRRGRTSSDRYLYVSMRMKELDRPLRSLYRNGQVCGLLLKGDC